MIFFVLLPISIESRAELSCTTVTNGIYFNHVVGVCKINCSFNYVVPYCSIDRLKIEKQVNPPDRSNICRRTAKRVVSFLYMRLKHIPYHVRHLKLTNKLTLGNYI